MYGKLLQADQQPVAHTGKVMSQHSHLSVFPNLAGSDADIWSSPQVEQENHICDDTYQ
jgi:hypothetical protein